MNKTKSSASSIYKLMIMYVTIYTCHVTTGYPLTNFSVHDFSRDPKTRYIAFVTKKVYFWNYPIVHTGLIFERINYQVKTTSRDKTMSGGYTT